MDWRRAKEIGTTGGCGLVALAILKRRGGTPLLRRDPDGCATHAAVFLDGSVIHLGDDDENLQVATIDELREACRCDFDPARADLRSGEIRRVVELMQMWT